MIRCPVTLRYARCGEPKQTWSSSERFSDVVTGKRLEIERVRRVTHGVNCPRRGPEFKAKDFEATA